MLELESVYKEQGTKVRCIRTCNAKEFLSFTFQDWLRGHGTTHELSATYSPESNGKAERINRTLIYIARPLLSHAPSKELRSVMGRGYCYCMLLTKQNVYNSLLQWKTYTI